MFNDPLANLKQFGLKSTDIVADLGAGGGAYTIPAARMARDGKVYAIDVQKDLLPRIDADAKAAHLSNIMTIWGDIEKSGGTKLKDSFADAALLCSVLFQAENKSGLAEEAARILKPEGRLLLIDWKDSFGGLGPRGDMIVAEDKAKEIFEKGGLKYEKNISAGEHHYGMIFKK
jgi:ubiquinone/menaquinone biosynthesis C-methylase UbiE